MIKTSWQPAAATFLGMKLNYVDFENAPVTSTKKPKSAWDKPTSRAYLYIDSVAFQARAKMICPKCYAKPGEKCATETGNTMVNNHKARLKAFKLSFPKACETLKP